MSKVRGIAAVVLNYKTWEDAVNCINDLKAQDYADKHIIVVENGSGNDSAAELKRRFDNDPLVTVLVSDRNLGFAKGNNLGIRYAHEKLGFDTVFVVNSDTRIPPSLFSEIAALDPTGVGTVSPTVVLASGERQVFDANSEDADKLARSTMVNLAKANIASLPVIRALYAKKASAPHGPEKGFVPQPKRYVLYGCSYFLMPDFFRHYHMLYPRTFLFGEEINLLICLKRAGLRSIYVDTTPMTHFGGRSTGTSAGGSGVNRFRLKHANRSVFRSLPMYMCRSAKAAARLIER